MARSGIRNVLGRHARLIVVAAGITLVAAPVRVLAQPTTYAAECKIVIKAIGPGGSAAVPDAPNSIETVGSFQTAIDIIESPEMAARVAKKLAVPVERVLGTIDARMITGTQVIALRAVDEEPTFAGTLCNAYAVAFLEHRHEAAMGRIATVTRVQRARLAQMRKDLVELDRRIRPSHQSDGPIQTERLALVSKMTQVQEEIVNLEAASNVGFEGAGQVIAPAGSAGTPVGPNDAFPIGLMAAGVFALAATGLMPRRRTGEV